MMHYLRGYARIELTGASPEWCLNRLSEHRIPFWDAQAVDELHVRCAVYQSDLPDVSRLALRAMCVMRVISRKGLSQQIGGLLRRPALLAGCLVAVVLALLAQSFVWTVQVDTDGGVPPEEIVHALEEEGVRFGTWGPGLDAQQLKHKMLLRLPSLRWLAANRTGGVVHVLYSERSAPETEVDTSGITNVTASRAGIITSMSVLGGFATVEPGDAVRSGQLLVSGIRTEDDRTQVTHAMAEIYALTRRAQSVRIPQSYAKAEREGRTQVGLSLVIGRKRINLFGNSRIFGMTCDKMVSRWVCTLPGGYEFPLALELTRAQPCRLQQAELPQAQAEQLLESFSERYVRAQMIAGTPLHVAYTMTKSQGCYELAADWSCEEMISVTVPVYSLEEDNESGEADQRGANGADH